MSTDADRREDARREDIDDRLDRRGVTCEDCGRRWLPGGGYCPACGGNIADSDEAVTRATLARALREAGWPSVAEDVHDGVPLETILSRLTDIGEDESDAYGLIAEAV